jgi:two-component system OmpR family response regulator
MQRHVLVVDDNGEVREIIVKMLEYRGYQVSSAGNGSAMRDFLKRDDSVAAVILDCVLPGEAGFTLATHLQERHLPVVMISGSPEAMAFADQHRLQLLRKPFGSQELYDALGKAISSGSSGQREI